MSGDALLNTKVCEDLGTAIQEVKQTQEPVPLESIVIEGVPEYILVQKGAKIDIKWLPKPPAPRGEPVEFVDNLLTLRGFNIDLAKARDTLLNLRDLIYCPECRMPNWLAEGSGEMIHYEKCRLGLLSEVLLKMIPKDGIRFRWKSNR